ncbi:hypothetical protein BCR42DRAFT_425932 [Absidia repens]|uniref:Uncharacterized protein n=1 Tax=Absidia repens TaxID=90262 RepID=A0A1X2I2B3_9FUNG|nr:hypothetical protein BCR42DRAFT_425932 [Absidia repens]
MKCPNVFIDKHIDINDTFPNSLFFTTRVINHWTFRHFLAWKSYDLVVPPPTVLQTLLAEYLLALQTLMENPALSQSLKIYLGRLSKYFKEQRVVRSYSNLSTSITYNNHHTKQRW